MVVGDSDQAVYAFRGADYRNLVRFEETFPDATVIVLEQNYRSTQSHPRRCQRGDRQQRGPPPQASLDRADRRRAPHPLPGRGRARRRPRSACPRRCGSPTTTATGYGDLAIFYRTNAQSRILEETLVRAGVPYRVVGGVKFYDRREIKDSLAYLRALINPDDEVSWKRIVNVPKRGVGDTSVAKIDAYASTRRA